MVGRLCGAGHPVSTLNSSPFGHGYAPSGEWVTLLIVVHGFYFHGDEVTGCVREVADVCAHEFMFRVHIRAVPGSFFYPLGEGVLVLVGLLLWLHHRFAGLVEDVLGEGELEPRRHHVGPAEPGGPLRGGWYTSRSTPRVVEAPGAAIQEMREESDSQSSGNPRVIEGFLKKL